MAEVEQQTENGETVISMNHNGVVRKFIVPLGSLPTSASVTSSELPPIAVDPVLYQDTTTKSTTQNESPGPFMSTNFSSQEHPQCYGSGSNNKKRKSLDNTSTIPSKQSKNKQVSSLEDAIAKVNQIANCLKKSRDGCGDDRILESVDGQNVVDLTRAKKNRTYSPRKMACKIVEEKHLSSPLNAFSIQDANTVNIGTKNGSVVGSSQSALGTQTFSSSNVLQLSQSGNSILRSNLMSNSNQPIILGSLNTQLSPTGQNSNAASAQNSTKSILLDKDQSLVNSVGSASFVINKSVNQNIFLSPSTNQATLANQLLPGVTNQSGVRLQSMNNPPVILSQQTSNQSNNQSLILTPDGKLVVGQPSNVIQNPQTVVLGNQLNTIGSQSSLSGRPLGNLNNAAAMANTVNLVTDGNQAANRTLNISGNTLSGHQQPIIIQGNTASHPNHSQSVAFQGNTIKPQSIILQSNQQSQTLNQNKQSIIILPPQNASGPVRFLMPTNSQTGNLSMQNNLLGAIGIQPNQHQNIFGANTLQIQPSNTLGAVNGSQIQPFVYQNPGSSVNVLNQQLSSGQILNADHINRIESTASTTLSSTKNTTAHGSKQPTILPKILPRDSMEQKGQKQVSHSPTKPVSSGTFIIQTDGQIVPVSLPTSSATCTSPSQKINSVSSEITHSQNGITVTPMANTFLASQRNKLAAALNKSLTSSDQNQAVANDAKLNSPIVSLGSLVGKLPKPLATQSLSSSSVAPVLSSNSLLPGFAIPLYSLPGAQTQTNSTSTSEVNVKSVYQSSVLPKPVDTIKEEEEDDVVVLSESPKRNVTKQSPCIKSQINDHNVRNRPTSPEVISQNNFANNSESHPLVMKDMDGNTKDIIGFTYLNNIRHAVVQGGNGFMALPLPETESSAKLEQKQNAVIEESMSTHKLLAPNPNNKVIVQEKPVLSEKLPPRSKLLKSLDPIYKLSVKVLRQIELSIKPSRRFPVVVMHNLKMSAHDARKSHSIHAVDTMTWTCNSKEGRFMRVRFLPYHRKVDRSKYDLYKGEIHHPVCRSSLALELQDTYNSAYDTDTDIEQEESVKETKIGKSYTQLTRDNCDADVIFINESKTPDDISKVSKYIKHAKIGGSRSGVKAVMKCSDMDNDANLSSGKRCLPTIKDNVSETVASPPILEKFSNKMKNCSRFQESSLPPDLHKYCDGKDCSKCNKINAEKKLQHMKTSNDLSSSDNTKPDSKNSDATNTSCLHDPAKLLGGMQQIMQNTIAAYLSSQNTEESKSFKFFKNIFDNVAKRPIIKPKPSSNPSPSKDIGLNDET